VLQVIQVICCKHYSFLFILTVPEAAPDNVSGLFNGTEVIVSWTKPPGRLNGQILGYRVEYRTPNKSKVTHVTVVKVNICCRLSLSLSVMGIFAVVLFTCFRLFWSQFSPLR
jgi:predicted transcriptional regulator